MSTGAGLFNLRRLSTETLVAIHAHLATTPDLQGKAETELLAMVRRILLQRGAA